MGGAPPVAMRTGLVIGLDAGSQTVIVNTVGAAQKCVTPDSRMCRQIVAGSSLRRHRCTPPIAVTAHGKHQPLQ